MELWNPIHKQWLKNRPEERIRLRVAEYFLQECQLSPSKIGPEFTVNLGNQKKGRIDLVCFDANYQAHCLVECKQVHIPLNEQVAQQIAKYHLSLPSPYLLITNGRVDVWFQRTSRGIEYLEYLPDEYKSTREVDRQLPYWVDRGFVYPYIPDSLHELVRNICSRLYVDLQSPPIYLDFEDIPAEFMLDNYYLITSFGEDETHTRIAFAMNGKGNTQSLDVILSEKGVSTKLLKIDLLALSNHESAHAALYTELGQQQVDVSSMSPLDNEKWMDKLSLFLSMA
ncbi:MAG: type I restriction enzyme HsdR N-terminal domain-containing protein [Balneolaceae bacterium]|jgi:hypothetical protein|nr:type I restriction enzyme HsdR N-terminal domain-containing protein [Balneolaceae bacterium]